MNGWILLGDSVDWPPVVEEARAVRGRPERVSG